MGKNPTNPENGNAKGTYGGSREKTAFTGVVLKPNIRKGVGGEETRVQIKKRCFRGGLHGYLCPKFCPQTGAVEILEI